MCTAYYRNGNKKKLWNWYEIKEAIRESNIATLVSNELILTEIWQTFPESFQGMIAPADDSKRFILVFN